MMAYYADRIAAALESIARSLERVTNPPGNAGPRVRDGNDVVPINRRHGTEEALTDLRELVARDLDAFNGPRTTVELVKEQLKRAKDELKRAR